MDLGNLDSSLEEEDLPGYYCAECSAARFAGEPSCASCGASRPDRGWRPLVESDDPFLGCVVDGRYLITKREASGGSSVVYRAQSIRNDHVVALKIARLGDPSSVDESSVRDRMSREVRAVQMLENAHIVPIYEFLELGGGPAAIVMEYVAGETAEAIVEAEGPLSVDRAADVGCQIARGLAEAHRSDLVHRDIKPANIMIESGDDDAAYILDFGIVRLQAASGTTQGFIGTPLYASPEQIRMRELDARTDVYSLGATLFYLLAGEPPFQDEEMMEVMRAHLESPAPSLQSRRGEEIPAELDRLVGRMLAKDRDERPEDLEEIAGRLEMFRTSNRLANVGGAEDEMDAGSTQAGLHEPVSRSASESSSRDEEVEQEERRSEEDFGAEISRPSSALGHVSSIDDPTSSSEFTPAASETAEFDRLSNRTGELSFDGTERRSETQTGVQPPASEDESRRLAAERSIDFWPEEDGSERSERGAPSGEEQVLDTRCGEGFVVADREGRLWQFESADADGDCLATFDAEIASAALGEAFLWVGMDDGTIERIRLADGDRENVVSASTGAAITSIAATPDDGAVVAGVESGEMLYRNLDVGEDWERQGGERAIESIDMTEGGDEIVLARSGGLVETIRPATSTSSGAQLEDDAPIRQLAVASSGDVLGILYRDGRAKVVHAPTGREVVDIPERSSNVEVLYFDSDGNICGVERGEASWVVRDLADGSVLTRVGARSKVRRR